MTHLLAWKIVAVAILSLFLIFPDIGSNWFRRGEVLLRRLSRHRGLALGSVAVTSLLLSAGLALLVRMPQPFAHDEFSYLLAADTFSHGRLTNPPHPLWEHFETFHVLQQPTYASKYPPGQGLALAVGETIFGHPIVGVWLATALACVAVCWMLYGWLPAHWALAGGLLTVVHPVVVEWSQCFWGGSMAMGGGALLLGAVPRIVRRARTCHAVLLGLGMTVLAISRPYEGMVLTLLSLGVLLWWMPGNVRGLWSPSALKHLVLPLGLVLGVTFAALGYYNFRVTGNPLMLPYQLHEATYGVTPLFIWQRPKPMPYYRHEVLRAFYADLSTGAYRSQNTLRTWLSTTRLKYADLLTLHFPTSFRYLLLPIIGVTLPFMLKRDPRVRITSLVLAGFLVGTLAEVFMSYRYTAPAFGLLFLFVLQSMHHLSGWTWRTMPLGRSLVRVCTLAGICALLLTNVRWVREPEEMALNTWGITRARIENELERDGQRHLVVVRYGPRHSPHREWVSNAADIDGAPVVWAREMDPESDSRLLKYFAGRRVWRLTVDDDDEPPVLVPYRSVARGR